MIYHTQPPASQKEGNLNATSAPVHQQNTAVPWTQQTRRYMYNRNAHWSMRYATHKWSDHDHNVMFSSNSHEAKWCMCSCHNGHRGHRGCIHREPKSHWSQKKWGPTKSDRRSVFGWLTVCDELNWCWHRINVLHRFALTGDNVVELNAVQRHIFMGTSASTLQTQIINIC